MAFETTYFGESSALRDLQLYRLGSEQFISSATERPILSAHYTIHYVNSGTGSVQIGNASYPVQPNSVFVVFPNQVRQILADSSEALHIDWVELDGSAVLPALTRLNLAANHPILPLAPTALPCKTEECFRELLGSDPRNREYQIGLCWMILGALSTEAAEKKVPRSVNQRKQYVCQAIELIERSYMQDITVEDIADYCRLNRSYLGKLFRGETGKSTQEYLIEYRMKVACRYLRETTAPIGTIALSVGYQNQLHFSRAFRKTYGLSPRDWQKEQRKIQSENH